MEYETKEDQMAQTEALTHFELKQLADWFLQHMPLDQRRRLMAEMPQAYAALFPGVSTILINDAVWDVLQARDVVRRDRLATELDTGRGSVE
jgi:hypothetical protein